MRVPHVLLLYVDLIPSVLLCGHVQLEWSAKSGQIEYRARAVKNARTADLNWADWVLLGRLDGRLELKMASLLKAADKKLIYIFDDDLLNVPAQFHNAGHFRSARTRENIQKMLALSDAIVSPSPILLKQYVGKRQFGLQAEEPAVRLGKYALHMPDAPVKLGFAGSIDRAGDVELLLRETLIRLKQTYGERIEIEFFGVTPTFAAEIGARILPFQNSYEAYLDTLNSLQWDIGLAPMPETPFHGCKHYIKFTEYASAGIAPVLSDAQPYSRLKSVFPAGLFCANTPEEWYRKISNLIENRPELERLRSESHSFVRTHMSVSASSEALFAALSSSLPLSRPKRIHPCLPLVRLFVFLQRCLSKVSAYGIRTPAYLLRKIQKKLR